MKKRPFNKELLYKIFTALVKAYGPKEATKVCGDLLEELKKGM